MLFVSRHQNFQHMIWRDRTRVVRLGEHEELVTDVPLFEAKFKAGRLTDVERRAAARMFGIGGLSEHDSRGVAMPYREDGVIIGAVGSAGEAYMGYDPQFHLASFDTETDIPYSDLNLYSDEEKAQAKQLCERVLSSSSDIPSSLVIVTERTIPAPWATYNDIVGKGAAAKIVSLTREIGIPVTDVIAYETEIGKRADVLEQLLALQADQEAQEQIARAERDALRVQVGR